MKDTVERVLPYWYDHIAADILAGKSVIVCAHGNSLRAIVKHLDKMSDEGKWNFILLKCVEVIELNIPTGIPLVYELDAHLKPVKHYYLASDAELKEKMSAVASQGKAKK